MMRLQLMLMSAKLKIVRLQVRNGAIWALIALFLANQILGSPEINDNLFFLMNMYIHICIIYVCAMNGTQSPTVLITHGQPS